MAETAGAAPAVRDAATIVLLRDLGGVPSVLMGQRGAGAAFMPSKFVFPGGAADPEDAVAPLAAPLGAGDAEALGGPDAARRLAAAAIRELWEETGLILGRAGDWRDPPAGWEGFAARGFLPDASALRFVFRAITPPGRPRRFDARFFLADAADLASDPDDFSAACDELSHLHWVPVAEARALNLPFITEVVLAEVAARRTGATAKGIPFFDNSGPVSRFCWL